MSNAGPAEAAGPILVVDDDRSIREAVSDLLLTAGYRVEVAENGAVALEAVRRQAKPALLLLDMMMPVMSGFELLELLLDGDVDLNQVPIVILSAFSAPLAAAGAPGGVKACLNKPVTAALLLQTVQACCRRHVSLGP
jgi:CheY-like chemotaxis protein